MSQPFKEVLKEVDSLEEAVGISIGAASVCWIPDTGDALFDSERAAEITEALVELVRDYVR